MDGLATTGAPAHARRSGWCDECGYLLRGLPHEQPCPECGHVPPEVDDRTSPQTAWSRCVFAGLALLLVLTVQGISSVLIQPFAYDMGGAVTALNVPGPKLWAVPLLQRPIGYAPERPGVNATRTALLGLLAVWLVTAAPASGATDRHRRDETARLLARWVSIIAFGLLFGALLASQRINRADTQLGFRALLIGAVELPGTALLYLYLRRLADRVPGRERRQAFGRLVWFVPLTIAAAAGILGTQYYFDATQQYVPADRASTAVGAAFGAVTVLCGVAATAAVASLASAYFALAFPRAGQWLAAGRYVSRRTADACRAVPDDFARRLAVATGAILLIVLMIFGNDMVLWMFTRQGFGGHLPFMNYPGPKVWAGVSLGGNGTRYYWDPVVTRVTFLMLHLLAVWLVSVPLRAGANCSNRLRLAVRWLPALGLGAGTGAIMIFDHLFPLSGARAGLRSEVSAASRFCSSFRRRSCCTCCSRAPPTKWGERCSGGPSAGWQR